MTEKTLRLARAPERPTRPAPSSRGDRPLVAALCLVSATAGVLGWRRDQAELVAQAAPASVARLRDEFPDDYAALRHAAEQKGARGLAVDRAVAEALRAWLARRAPAIADAPPEALREVMTAHQQVLLAARAQDPRLCADLALPGSSRGHAPPPSLILTRATERERAALVTAAMAGATSPAPPSDPGRTRSLERRRLDRAAYHLAHGDAASRSMPSERRCAAALDLTRTVLGLPADEARTISAAITERGLDS